MKSKDLKNVLAAIRISKQITLEGESLLVLCSSLAQVSAFIQELEAKERAEEEAKNADK